MINQILPLLNSYLPIHYAIKGLQSLSPEMSGFISNATAAGYTSDQVLQYLRDRFESQSIKQEKHRLSTSSNLRPDEAASFEKMKQSYMPGDILQHVVSSGVGLAAGLKGRSKALEPTLLMDTVKEPMKARDDFSRASESYNKALQDQRNREMAQSQAALQTQSIQNPIEAIAPELHSMIVSAAQKGIKPTSVIREESVRNKFRKEIKKIEDNTGENILKLVMDLYPFGNEQMQAQPEPLQQMEQSQAALQSGQPGQQDRIAALQAALAQYARMRSQG